MTLAMEDICNIALRRIGYPTPIGWIYEGSPAARVAVEIYSQCRDDLLRGADWDFARQQAPLVLLKTAPVGGYGFTPWNSSYPPVNWQYEYDYPAMCLEVRAVRPTPSLLSQYDPSPNVFALAYDNTLATPSPVILTNLINANAVFTAQVTDPDQWTAGYANALYDKLAVRFQQALAPDANMEKLKLAEEAQGAAEGRARQG